MKRGSCPRLFEAEAMRDGRLGGAELASFGRHLTLCSVCRGEVQALDALAEALRPAPATADGSARHPAGGIDAGDELRVQRERTRLLAAFDRELVTPARRRGVRRLFWPLAAAAAVGLLLVWRGRPLPPATPAAVVVSADPSAVWSKRQAGPREEIRLQRGRLWIQVKNAGGPGRLVVLLPDGALEDIGTTFTVSAEQGRTTRVAVDEGRVLLRLRGRPALLIERGGTWSPEAPGGSSAPANEAPPPAPAPSRATPPPSMAAPPPPAPGPAGAPSATPRPASSTSPQPPSAPPGARAAPDAVTRRSASPEPAGAAAFRAALAAFDAGHHRAAADAFARFLARHPGDGRAEDAAYLRLLALQRLGARAEMRRAAEEYLRRHPAGFRRREVERLSPDPEPNRR